MKLDCITNRLWGREAQFRYLLIAAIILLFTALGAREIWTQEHRWADIVSGMFYRHDFLHPYLGESRYYDKPLLSYWLIAFFSMITGGLSTWTLRLPSALAGLLAIWSIYQLGSKLKDKSFGLMSGWLMLTTYYFVFWSRTSSADMLNLAGSLFAVSWYFNKREKAGFLDFSVFFLIIALTALCKGLVGAIVPCIAVLIDIAMQKSWRQYFRWPLFLALLPALIVYLLPFWASSYFGGESYGQSGLYLVYRENILRYFHPFDHQGPIYTYFIFLPIYLLPATLFFLPALFSLPSRWRVLSASSRWIVWTLFALFLFFTLSGSRRSYYVLPIVPFAILFTADWLLTGNTVRKQFLAMMTVILAYVLLFVAVDVLPAWYYAQTGANRFAVLLKSEAEAIKPWQSWNVVFLDAESKLNFYLGLPPNIRRYDIPGNLRNDQTAASLLQVWPILNAKPENTIFVTRKMYVPLLQAYFTGYRLVEPPVPPKIPFVKSNEMNMPAAFIPQK